MLLRRHRRRPRAVRREVDERGAVQPRRAGARERDPRRDRRAAARAADVPRPPLAPPAAARSDRAAAAQRRRIRHSPVLSARTTAAAETRAVVRTDSRLGARR